MNKRELVTKLIDALKASESYMGRDDVAWSVMLTRDETEYIIERILE